MSSKKRRDELGMRKKWGMWMGYDIVPLKLEMRLDMVSSDNPKD